MMNEDAKLARERAKAIAEARRAERRSRKRKCVVCSVEESERFPLNAHPDGIGPACRTCLEQKAALR
jgi:hypothetical protein